MILVRRPNRAWPRGIVEIASKRSDPRADPQATQRISREELEEALRRTKSGMRAAVRSSPEVDRGSLAGPRDDEGPEIAVVPVDGVEVAAVAPASLPPPVATSVATPSKASPLSPSINLRPSERSLSSLTRRLHVTPQLALLVGLAIVAFVTLAAIVGFFAGRVTGP